MLSILELPQELLCRIVGELHPSDITSIRLVNCFHYRTLTISLPSC
jgi:hypothetical protein